jgi:hypothetical protein
MRRTAGAAVDDMMKQFFLVVVDFVIAGGGDRPFTHGDHIRVLAFLLGILDGHGPVLALCRRPLTRISPLALMRWLETPFLLITAETRSTI